VIISNGVFTQTARAVSAAAEIVDLISLESLEQRLLDVVSPLQRYVHDYETSNIFTGYVPTGGLLSPLFGNDGEDKVEDLCAEIQAVFGQDAASFVSILGDFGGGKTTLLDRLKYEYAMKYLQDKSGLIPVFFQLKDSHRYPELDVLISRTLQREFEREIPRAPDIVDR
jgi:predicted NACHT family NTPase